MLMGVYKLKKKTFQSKKYAVYTVTCFTSHLFEQIQDISVETEDNKEKKSAKDALLLWCQMKSAG